MSRLLGYMCSDDTLTHSLIDEVSDDLDHPNPDQRIGHGVGWVQEGRSLLRKQPPQGASGGQLSNVIADIPSREIVGYECDADSEAIDTLDLQPFCFRTWVYAQDGDLENLEGREEEMLAALPDHIRRNIQGESVEEVCFHTFLDELQNNGGFGLSQSAPSRCAEALHSTIQQLESRLADDKSSDQILETDHVAISERLLLAFAGSDHLYYRKFEGIEETQEEPLFAGHRPQVEKHPHFRAVLLTNGLEQVSDEWTQVPPRSLVWVGSDWEVDVVPFDEFGE